MIIDDGEIVAKGTPYELRNTYSSDMLKIEPTDHVALDELFKVNGINYKNEHQLMLVKLANTKEALSILKLAEPYIANFEVLHGTMDDVFIEITGKEIRADV